MSNPFIQSSSGSSNITVNHKKANVFGNISIGIPDIPNLQSPIDTLSTGGIAVNLSQLHDCTISDSKLNN